MKGLFIVFHGFSAHSGISKKIFAQCEALRLNGVDIALCHLEIGADGTQRRMAGDTVIRTFGSGLRAKLLKRVSYADITDYIRREGVRFLYIRHDLNANPLLVGWLRRVRRLGCASRSKSPPTPTTRSSARPAGRRNSSWRIDRMFRRAMARQVDRIVTFSDDAEIFGQKTVRISNGIDFGTIPLKTEVHDLTREVRLLALANIHPWHGFDRVIEGLKDYYAAPHGRTVKLRIVGDGMPDLIGSYARSIEAYGLGAYVEITGPRSGAALDAEFAWCDMGVASLARPPQRHREPQKPQEPRVCRPGHPVRLLRAGQRFRRDALRPESPRRRYAARHRRTPRLARRRGPHPGTYPHDDRGHALVGAADANW